MAKYFKEAGIQEHVSYLSKNRALKRINKARNMIHSKIMWMILPFLLVSPILFYSALLLTLVYYYREIHSEFLGDTRKLERYEGIFEPKSSTDVMSIVGYQVFEDEFESHSRLAKGDSKEAMKKLAEKQKTMRAWKNRWRHVGFGKKLLTTHLMVPGKTGAGKTELVRSIADDACLSTGGGFLFNDGKSDTKLMREFISQAVKMGRETSVSAMNFLKPEKNAETNTFSPLNIMHPVKTVEFLGGLTGGGGGDGTTQYFFEQGKSMLFPVVNATFTRHKLHEEGYNLEKIFDNTKLHNLIIIRVMFYCMCRDINKKILESNVLKSAISTVTIAPADDKLEAIEKLIEYVTQNATQVKLVKEHTGYEYVDIKEVFINCYSLLDSYLGKIWNQYTPLLDIVSRVMYYVAVESDGKKFYGDGAMNIREVKEYFHSLQNLTNANADGTHLKLLNERYNLIDGGFQASEIQKLEVAFHRKPPNGNILTPPTDAVQQLAYAQQQFNSLANIFALYKHVFGQSNPEIKPDKLIKDNRFLYVVLPPLELNPSLTEILGKIIIATVKEVAAIALLGEKLSLHKTLMNIFKDRLTPKPFTFIVLDEYGAYPVEGIDLLLAQIRSLNMCACIAVQDNASLKVGGESQTSQERALANTTKVIAKTEDKDLVEWVRSMISDITVETPKLQKDLHGDWTTGADIELKEEKSFNVEKLRDLGNGFSLVLLGSKEEDLVFMQSFYRGGDAGTIFIKRYENLIFR